MGTESQLKVLKSDRLEKLGIKLATTGYKVIGLSTINKYSLNGREKKIISSRLCVCGAGGVG